jgi:hypothetical protein
VDWMGILIGAAITIAVSWIFYVRAAEGLKRQTALISLPVPTLAAAAALAALLQYAMTTTPPIRRSACRTANNYTSV